MYPEQAYIKPSVASPSRSAQGGGEGGEGGEGGGGDEADGDGDGGDGQLPEPQLEP